HRPRGQRRRGGQPGHPGATRTLIPVEEVDEVVVIKPAQCTHCQAPLSGDDPTPWRHQMIELPPIKPVVTEYQWHQLACPTCGATTRAPWPAGVPSGTYGPRVQATVALYTGSYRLSKRTTQQAMSEVFGVPMRVGTISQLEQATTAVLDAPVEEARTYVHEQAVAHLDETSWRQGGKRAWLWVAVTSWVTVFVVRMSRGGQVARELLGERLLVAGSRSGVPKTAGTCHDILKRREALWTFVQVEGVEPTNNAAERSIRPGVLWRKGSFGTQSAEGSRFVESMMTVVTTLQQQQRNVLEFLTAACEAALRGEAAPSLLPASDQEAQTAA